MKILLGVFIALVTFSLPLYSETKTNLTVETPAKSSPLNNVKENVDDSAKEQAISDEDINRFTNTIVLIKDFYVQPTKDKNLLDDAIRGMVGGLDPHSEYLDKQAYKTLLMTTSGAFGGVGIKVTPEFGILKIVSPIDDTPASKAGIQAGDYIVAIDAKLVSEMSLQKPSIKCAAKQESSLFSQNFLKGEKIPLHI